jgi:ABC-type bacteriocin/lantibiotic exporter with double-glycine peptidase domain
MGMIEPKLLAAFVKQEARTPVLGTSLQKDGYSCGPVALMHCCKELGLQVTEPEMRELTDVDSDGADEHKLIEAIEALGLGAEALYNADPDEAWASLIERLGAGMPCLLCVDGWDHWVAAVGTDGDRVALQDSERTEENKEANGLHLLTREELEARWQNADEDRPFYAIAVSRR